VTIAFATNSSCTSKVSLCNLFSKEVRRKRNPPSSVEVILTAATRCRPLLLFQISHRPLNFAVPFHRNAIVTQHFDGVVKPQGTFAAFENGRFFLNGCLDLLIGEFTILLQAVLALISKQKERLQPAALRARSEPFVLIDGHSSIARSFHGAGIGQCCLNFRGESVLPAQLDGWSVETAGWVGGEHDWVLADLDDVKRYGLALFTVIGAPSHDNGC